MSDETINYFRFDESTMCQESIKGTEFKDNTQYNYSMLYKVFETKSHFYIYVSKLQAYVITKKDIVTGSAEELSQLLKSKFGKKYKYYKFK